MLDETNFELHLSRLSLPAEGAEYVRRVRASPPQRAVATNYARNVASHVPSRKMGVTIQSESRTGERPLLLELEYSDDVVAYWDQPTSVQVEGFDRRGRVSRYWYTADFLAMTRSGVTAFEIKPRTEIAKRVRERPKDWMTSGQGFVYRAAKVAYERLGILHIVRCPDEFSLVRTENLELLLRSRSSQASYTCAERSKLMRVLERHGAIPLSYALSEAGLVDSAPLLAMVDRGELFTILDRFRLADAETAWIALDANEMRHLEQLPPSIVALAQPAPHSAAPTIKECKRIARRLELLSGTASHHASRTTLWRLRKALKAANGNPLALATQYHRSGPRASRLSPQHDELISRVIQDIYCTPGTQISAAYNMYVAIFSEATQKQGHGLGTMPVSPATFRSRLREKDARAMALARGGKRAANAADAPTDPCHRGLKPLRAFEQAHLDHWYSDLYVLVREDEGLAYACRPYVTFLIDSATGSLLAFVVTLESPSRRTCARLIRDCVRRHGRLPEKVTTDAGAEFRSNFYHACLAEMVVELCRRPVANGRFGSEVERSFLIFKSQVLGGLAGYIAATKDDRSASRAFRADQQAAITLDELHQLLERFRTDWYNAHPRGDRTKAPSILVRESLDRCSLSGTVVDYDQAFLISTSVPLARSDYKRDHARGLRAQGRHYTPSPGPLPLRIDEVRVDPDDLLIIYAHSGDYWYPLYSGSTQAQVARGPTAAMYSAILERTPRSAEQLAELSERSKLGSLLLDARRSTGQVASEAHTGTAAAPERLPEPAPPQAHTRSNSPRRMKLEE